MVYVKGGSQWPGGGVGEGPEQEQMCGLLNYCCRCCAVTTLRTAGAPANPGD